MGASVLHATAVSYEGRAALICGASGSGKSALALEMMALGARLIADDGVELDTRDGALWARCPESIKGRIEARFVGILAAEPAAPAPVHLVVDLDEIESERLPERQFREIEGVEIAALHKIEGRHFAAAILLYLKGGRVA